MPMVVHFTWKALKHQQQKKINSYSCCNKLEPASAACYIRSFQYSAAISSSIIDIEYHIQKGQK